MTVGIKPQWNMVFPTLTTAASRFLVDGLKAMEINDPIDQRIRIESIQWI